MFARPSIRSTWRRVAARGLGLSLAGAIVFAPLTPVLAAPAAEPPLEVPAGDVLDVDFGRGTADDLAQGFTATPVGGVAFLDDPDLGQTVASFDGDDDAYHYRGFARAWTDDELAHPTSAFTQQCTFRYTGESAPGGPEYACRVNEGGGFGFYLNGTTLTANLQTTSNNDWITAAYTPGEWVDAVQTYDGSTWSLYIDGRLMTSKARTGDIRVPGAATRAYTVGDSPANADWNLEGDVAATRVWSRALSPAEVAAVHEGNVEEPEAVEPRIVPDANVLDVDLSRGSADDIAQGFTATAVGDVAIVPDPERGQVARFDGVDSAYHYDGFAQVWTDDRYARPKETFTQQCTFRYTGESTPSGPQYLCRVNNPGGFGFYIDGSALTVNLHTTEDNNWISGAYTPGEWVDAVQTYDGSTWSLYVDGELVSTAKRGGEVRVPDTASRAYTLGDSPTNADWNFEGDIAASRVWDTALTPYQVRALHDGSAEIPDVDVVETVPAHGEHLTSEVVFEARLQNAEAATGWTYLLDGEPIEPGDRIGTGLAAGAHEIVITATGPRGENLKWVVPFTSEVMPTGGGTETGQGAGTVTLSAIATNPSGGEVTTTFHEAEVTTAGAGFQGIIDAIPATLDFEYRDGEEIGGDQEPDGDLIASPTAANRSLVFQRFDVVVPEAEGNREVVWSGVVDPQRSVSLWAWHESREEWVELTSSRGRAEGDTLLRGTLRGGFDKDGTVHVMVIGEDPFSDDVAPRDASAGQPENRDRFEEPEDYDFAIAHISDTQNISQIAGNVCPQYNPGAEDVMRDAYAKLTGWIAEHAEARKIAYATHTGDLIESNMTSYPDLCEQNAEQVAAEFAFADEMQAILEDAGVVNSVLPGNHDNANGTDNGPGTVFNQTFGADRYYAAAQGWPEGASYHPWDEVLDEDGEVVTPGVDNDNSYVLFSAGGLDFVAVSLGFGVTAEEADWAASVFERYSDRSGILLAHAYLGASSQPDGRSSTYTGDGGILSERVVDVSPNVFLVLSGHVHGVGTNVNADAGVSVDRRHGVVEILADYQEYRVPAAEVWPDRVLPGGGVDLDGDGEPDYGDSDGIILGASFLRLLQIDTESSTMSVDTYSPYLDNFGATEYDGLNRYNGAEDNFTVPIDLPTRTTTIATDGLSVVTPTDTVIGESTTRSGWPASVEWSGLIEGELYAWTATSRDASGEVLGLVNQFGSLFRATAAGTDREAPVLTVPGATSIEAGSVFDPLDGVTAVDNTDGDVTDQVQVIGDVDTTTPGAYALQYVVADANGNQATALRAVTVTEPVAAGPGGSEPGGVGPGADPGGSRSTAEVPAGASGADHAEDRGQALPATGAEIGAALIAVAALLVLGGMAVARARTRTGP
ncbi:LamG-like jellyroll fold domain-containing protein [uncultured Aeromicrobium sp.]|uniref:LamG-like jellyroll fold domain-containing protein n=1 Tax=uncultured Aeromicrobium sp. TaxID=337820 RepID=UPI0025FE7D7E|nr:LamG-like jellyroll fold domain-containing protein [uncultured Aeromicrobium sp.]